MTPGKDEQAEALAGAQRWCAERHAEVLWDERETRCRIRVTAPGGGVLEGAGAGYFEAYVACRVQYDAAGPRGRPSWF